MRAREFTEAEHRGGIDVEEHEDVEDPSAVWITASAHGRELGRVRFYRQGDTVVAQSLEVKPEYRGQGIAKIMYDYAKEQGYRVLRSAEQTDAGYQFWEKNRPRQGVWEDNINEINAPGQLKIDPTLVERFTGQGWEILGEGNDQIVLARPGSRSVLKIVGTGSADRTAKIKQYVNFFRGNQRNPYFPRVGSDREITWQGKKYYAYTQERLRHLDGDEEIMDYLEDVMGSLMRDETPNIDRMPPGLHAGQVDGLIAAAESLISSGMAGHYEFDLGNVYNIMQRDNGQLVIVDPFTSLEAVDENFADKKVKGRSRPGRVKRASASCAGSVTDLRARAKKYGGERGKMYHWCANMKAGRKKANEEVNEVQILARVKGKGSEPGQLPKFGREIRPGEETRYLGIKVGDYKGYEIWRDYLGGQLSYHLFDPDARTVVVTTFGSRYHGNPHSYIIHGLYAAPGNPIKAHEFYRALIQDLGLTLVSDRKQSPGGNRVWQNLERYNDITVYGYNTKTGEVVNIGARDSEMYAVPPGAAKSREMQDIARNMRLVATAR